MKVTLKYLLCAAVLMASVASTVLSCTDTRSQLDRIHRQIEEPALAALAAAVGQNDPLTGFTPVAENGAITAYKVTFKSAGDVTVYNGSHIASVTEDAARVVFTLTDGSQIIIPKLQALTIALQGDQATIKAGETVTVGYTIEGAEDATVTVLCGDGWSAVVKASGKQTGTIIVTAPTPVEQDKVIVFAGDGTGRLVAVEMRLTVDTSGNPDPPDTEVILNPVPAVYEVPRFGGEIVAALIANVDYDVETDAPWLHYQCTKAVRTDNLSFRVDANDGAPRVAIATVTSGKYSTTIAFRQSGHTNWIRLSSTSMNFGAEGGSKLLDVTSNVDYTYTVSDDWVSISLAEGVTAIHYIVSAVPNTAIEARSAAIVFSGEGVEQQVLEIIQGGQSPYLLLSCGPYDFAADGGTGHISVSCNVDYNISVMPGASWLTFTPEESEEADSYIFTVDPNGTFSPRRASLTFTGEGVEPQTITITQGAPIPYMVVSRRSFSFTSDGGTGSFTVTANVDYSYSVSVQDWLSVSEAGTTEGGSKRFSILAAANNTIDSRTATITFSSDYADDHIIEVSQEGEKPYLTLSEKNIELTGTLDSETVYVSTNVTYLCSTVADWLTIDKTASDGTDAVTITASANDSYKSRSTTVVFSSQWLTRRIVTVVQQGKQAPSVPHTCIPVSHIMPCCRVNNAGTKFFVAGQWTASHQYYHIDEARSILQHIKDAGINIICIDFTNPSQWDDVGQAALHNSEGEFWQTFKPMLDNIIQACEEKQMQFFLFIGDTRRWGLDYWNFIAGVILERWAHLPSYRRYGFGDNKPLLVVFHPGSDFAAQLKAAPASQKNNLLQFHIGTCQVNSAIIPTTTDGWGYRNYSQSSDGKVRFACPNGGVPPQDWYRVDAEEWQRRVKWALGASEYAVIGSYDDTCDAIFWGIADVRGSRTESHRNAATEDDPFVYYNIVRDSLK